MTSDPLFRPIPGSPQERALGSPADIVIFGGANGGGKTAGLVGAASRGIGDPGWTAAVFRRTYPELDQPGGVIDQSKKFYPDPEHNYNESKSRWKFPGGAQVKFSHLQHESSKQSWDGAELTFVGFDQLESFERSQFFYLLGRLRSPDSAFQPHCFATCNPAPKGHWLYEFVSGWLDEDGFPDPDMAGQLRYFRRDGDDIRWVAGPEVTDSEGLEPMSVAFVPATVEDNPHIGDNYKRNLNSLGEADRQEKRHGRWGVVRDDSPLSGHTIQVVDQLPDSPSPSVRYWDIADTEPHPGNPDPSHTAGVKAYATEQLWTVCQHSGQEGDCRWWCEGQPSDGKCARGHDQLDTRPRTVICVEHAEWFQRSGDAKDQRIRGAAKRDGYQTIVAHEQEPGSSGKDVARKYQRALSDWEVVSDRPTGSKYDRMALWVPMAETGRIKVRSGRWSQDFIDALVGGDPQDVRDAMSGAVKVATDRMTVDGDEEMFFI